MTLSSNESMDSEDGTSDPYSAYASYTDGSGTPP